MTEVKTKIKFDDQNLLETMSASPRSPRPKLQSQPSPAERSSQKTLYLIRHGTGTHNSKAAVLTDSKWLDAPLDPIGEHQAVQLSIRYKKEVWEGSRPVDLVVSR